MPNFRDPTERFLQLLFHRTVHGVLGAAAFGCGQQDDPAWLSPACEAEEWNLAPNIRPALELDYRSERYPSTSGGAVIMSEYGSPCEGARDETTCLQQVAAAGDAVQGSNYWLTTAAGDVELWITAEQSLALLGRIDTRDEAFYALQLLDHHGINCSDADSYAARPVPRGFEVRVTVPDSECPEMTGTRHTLLVTSDGEVNELFTEQVPTDSCWVEGRRPPGLRARAFTGGSGVLARHFSRAAHFEAASVHSFRMLARELSALGAPAGLVRRAQRAAREEVQHARSMGALARRFRGTYQPPTIVPRANRGLPELTLDNAAEGCVNETFAALAATYQARAARDPQVARIMARIAADETGHASFSWCLARWAEDQMGPIFRARIRHARRAAVDQLRAGLDHDPHGLLQQVAGMPDAATAHRLLDGLEATLLAAPSSAGLRMPS